jgi:hypothetical protein
LLLFDVRLVPPPPPSLLGHMACRVTAWDAWQACSVSCGGSGMKLRRRHVVVQARRGGSVLGSGSGSSNAHCPQQLVQREVCDTGPCAVHCAVSAWGAWGPLPCPVTCGGGTQARARHVVSHAQHGGFSCPPLVAARTCNRTPCPIDCATSEWGGWSACSASCAWGLKARTRRLITEAWFGGAPCPNGEERGEALREEAPCNDGGPCPVHCVVSAWGGWGGCSATCSGGEGAGITPRRARVRVVAREALHGGVVCPALAEEGSCANTPCPVDCVVGAWASAAAPCPVSCGSGGFVLRSRPVAHAAAHGGLRCPPTRNWVACNADVGCPVDCEWGGWSSWSACPVSCGGVGCLIHCSDMPQLAGEVFVAKAVSTTKGGVAEKALCAFANILTLLAIMLVITRDGPSLCSAHIWRKFARSCARCHPQAARLALLAALATCVHAMPQETAEPPGLGLFGLAGALAAAIRGSSDDDDEEEEEEEEEVASAEEDEEEFEGEFDEDGGDKKGGADDDSTPWNEGVQTADIDMRLWNRYCISISHSMPDEEAFAAFIDLLTRSDEVQKKEKPAPKKREFGPIRETLMDLKHFAVQWPTTQSYNSKATQFSRADPATFMSRKAPDGRMDGPPDVSTSTIVSTTNLWEYNAQQLMEHKITLRGRLYGTRESFFEMNKQESTPAGVGWWYTKEKRLHMAVVDELKAKQDEKDQAHQAQSWFQRRQNAEGGATDAVEAEDDVSEDVEAASRKKPNYFKKECVCTVKAWTFAAVADTLFRRDPYRVLTKQVLRELGYHNRAEKFGTGFAFNFSMHNKHVRDHNAAKKHMDRIRGDTSVLKLIAAWWEMLVPWNTGEKELSREQYLRWNMRMFRALIGTVPPAKGDGKQMARKLAIVDWEFDFVQEKGRQHGIKLGYIDETNVTMNKVQFRDSVLRLADMWIPTASPDDYISFLRGLEVWVPADPILLGTEQEPGPAHFHIKQWPSVDGGQLNGFEKLHLTTARAAKPHLVVPGPGMYFSQTMHEKLEEQTVRQEHLDRVRGQNSEGSKPKRKRKPQAIHLCDPNFTMLRNGEGQGSSFGLAGKNQDPVDPRWLADPAFVGGALNVTGPGELGGGGMPGPVRARETKFQDDKIKKAETWKIRPTRKGAIEKEKEKMATTLAETRRITRMKTARPKAVISSTQQSIMGGSGTLYLGPDTTQKKNKVPATPPSTTAARRIQEKLGLTMLDSKALNKIKNPQTYQLLVRYLQKIQSLPDLQQTHQPQQTHQVQYFDSLPSATAPAPGSLSLPFSPVNTERPRTAPAPTVRRSARSPTPDLDDGYNHKPPVLQRPRTAQTNGRSQKITLPSSPNAQKASAGATAKDKDRPATASDILARKMKTRPSSMVEDFQRNASSSKYMPEITKVMSAQMGKTGHMEKAIGATKTLHAQLSSSYSRVHDMTAALTLAPTIGAGAVVGAGAGAGSGAELVPSRLNHANRRMASATQKQSQSQPFVPRPGKEPDRGVIENMLLQRKSVQSR